MPISEIDYNDEFDRLAIYGTIDGCERMNLKDLKYLVALADTGHFGRAAQRTFVSQPTLSAQLKKLEEYLGVKLVERHPKNVQLTDVGKEIVARARRMLSEGDEILALARNNTDPLAGKLKVALIPTIGPYLLPRVMQKLRKALPQLRLMLYEYQTEDLLKRLSDGEIDLGILALPVDQDGLESRRAVSGGIHGRAAQRPPARAEVLDQGADLKGQTLLLLEDGHCLRDQALEVCSRVDVREAEDFRATSLETLRHMVVAGLGITLMPELAVESPFGSQRGLTIRQFSKPAPSRTVGAVWRKSTTRGAAIDAVCDVVAGVDGREELTGLDEWRDPRRQRRPRRSRVESGESRGLGVSRQQFRGVRRARAAAGTARACASSSAPPPTRSCPLLARAARKVDTRARTARALDSRHDGLAAVRDVRVGAAGRSDVCSWIDPVSIAGGRLDGSGRCRRVDRIRAARRAPVLLRDGSSCSSPSQGFDARFFAYDWRLGIDEIGARSRRAIAAGRPVVLVAHSMGALVARVAIRQLPKRLVRRLIMLGAPNRGSFAPVLALRGTYPFVQKLSRLDLEHSPDYLATQVF